MAMKLMTGVVAAWIAAATLNAHALVVDAAPAPGALVSGPDVGVQLRFNSRIDPHRSRLSVVLPNHEIRALAISPQSSPTTLASEAKGLPGGKYTLRWQVLSTDGHITRGEFAFTVQ